MARLQTQNSLPSLSLAGQRLRLAVLLTCAILVGEVLGGYFANSLALLADAGNTVLFRAHDGTAEKIRIRQIGNQGDRVAVQGISAGDTVITVGNQMVSQGTQISLMLEDGRQP